MERIRKYNEVLGLKGSVNAQELKKLYRNKAKSLHPDAPGQFASHDQFVLLKEAYEFYIDQLNHAEEAKKAEFVRSKKYPGHYYEDKLKAEARLAARKRAAERKRKKYERFEKLGYFKKLDRLFYAFDILRFILALMVLFVLPVFLFLQDEFRGLIVALFLQFITYRLWSRAIKRIIHIK